MLPVAANFNGFLQQNRPQGDIPSAGQRAVKSVADPGIEACIVACIPVRVTTLGAGQMAINIARRETRVTIC